MTDDVPVKSVLEGATATYSPEDNKLRLYPVVRLDEATYQRIHAAGFRWAPRQEIFVAPSWTPEREDVLTELCGEVGDEDTSLVERTEERAERFEEYSAKRLQDSEAAERSVKAITDRIPFGQPILVGHHSERSARADQKRIERGMDKAVKMWRTSQYWEARAKSALRHARYKERPDVRARRIKKLEAEQRKQERTRREFTTMRKLWHAMPELKLKKKDGTEAAVTMQERAVFVANRFRDYNLYSDLRQGKVAPMEAQAQALATCERVLASCARWHEHLSLRLAYERTLLEAQGGTVADRKPLEKGGGVKCWASPRGGWSYIQQVNRVSVSVLDNWGNGGPNFRRTIPFDKLAATMTATEVAAARAAGTLRETEDHTGFFIV